MKRIITLALTFFLILSLSACDNQNGNHVHSQSQGVENLNTDETLQKNENNATNHDDNNVNPTQDDMLKGEDETSSDIVNQEILPVEIEAAKQAALDYYKKTVFEIQALTQIELCDGWDGEIMFQVSCLKDGEQQVDRMIALSKQNGTWIVVSEGY